MWCKPASTFIVLFTLGSVVGVNGQLQCMQAACDEAQYYALEDIAASVGLGTYKNNGDKCGTDTWQSIVDNNDPQGKPVRVGMDIQVGEECPLQLAISDSKLSFTGGGSDVFLGPPYSARKYMTVPRGKYLIAQCSSNEDAPCQWTIGNVRP